MKEQGKDVRRQDHIIMLGTGNAHATRCYNTCFTLHSSGGALLLVDAGGGNGILAQLEKAGLEFADIKDVFVTHAHTDHLLGVVWLIRMMPKASAALLRCAAWRMVTVLRWVISA